MRTCKLLGTDLLITSYEELTQRCQEWARSGKTIGVDLTNTHIVTLRRHDAGFRKTTSSIDYFVPDSSILTWSLNARGAKLRERVYGPIFMRYCIENSPPPFTHYLLGGSRECVQLLTQRFAGAARICGAHHGYFARDVEDQIVAEINELAPDFIWIGLGTPKQQEWINRNKDRIRRGVLFAVGFAFDVNSGLKRDAPQAWQRLGLTWLYRMLSEPRRLAGRYLKYNTLFLYYLMTDAFRRS